MVRLAYFSPSALDLIDHCRYLNFEGVEMLQEGKYATSIPLEYALDHKNDVMLAFGMNGRVLHPDHGYVRTRLCSSVAGSEVDKGVF